jgi:hypothetical protein
VPGRIVFQPSIKGLPALDNPDRVYGGPGRNDSLVATITHELAHRLQWRTDPQFGKLTSVSPEQAKIGVGLGFRKVDVDGATKWLLEAKGDGKVPVFYTQIEDKWNSDWARCTAEGKLIFDEKKPSKLVSRISNDEMREQMKVPAPTTYLRNPTETTADLVTAYRLGGASLKNLIANYPEAHAIARDLDRADIIKAWGADEKGEPKYVRINDRLVANSPEARQKLQDFEEEARKLHGKERAKK